MSQAPNQYARQQWATSGNTGFTVTSGGYNTRASMMQNAALPIPPYDEDRAIKQTQRVQSSNRSGSKYYTMQVQIPY